MPVVRFRTASGRTISFNARKSQGIKRRRKGVGVRRYKKVKRPVYYRTRLR